MSEEVFSQRENAISEADFAKLQKLILVDLKNYPYQLARRFIGTYRREDISNYLEMPEIFYNQIQLRYISKYLYNMSTHYKRLIIYFANMLTFDFVVEPYDLDPSQANVKKFKKAYQKAVDLVETMNIRHEFQKIATVVFREDVFFGYVHMNNDSFFIQPLLSDFCKISSIEDGVFNFAFDFTYFDAFPNRLYMFPEEFQQKYAQYIKGATRWQELSAQNTICIKVNQDIEYPIPPFVGVFPNLLDIQDFKDLRKQRAEIGNYKLLVQQIPIREDSQKNNDYAITLDHVNTFHQNVSTALPDQVGLITSPMPITPIDFERDHPDVNQVAESTQEFWDASGVSQMLFSAQSGPGALANSIVTDEVIGYSVLRQFERWTNRFLKEHNGAFKFRVTMPNITVFNKSDWVERFTGAAQYGLPVKSYLIAALGLNPSVMQNMTFLENEVLALHESFIPLASSHTQSGNSGQAPASPTEKKAGRPELEPDELSVEGSNTREKGKNIKK